MKRSQYQRLQKFYSTISEQELRDLLMLKGSDSLSTDIKELVEEELTKRQQRQVLALALIERKRKYAMCLSRGVAIFIDFAIISLPLLILIPFNFFENTYFKLHTLSLDSQAYYKQGLGLIKSFAFYYAVMFIFYTTFFMVKVGFTLGQKILSIKIVDYQERPLNYKQAFLRNLLCLLYFTPYLGGALMLISIILCCLNKRRQMLHDLLCRNLVLKFKPEKEIEF